MSLFREKFSPDITWRLEKHVFVFVLEVLTGKDAEALLVNASRAYLSLLHGFLHDFHAIHQKFTYSVQLLELVLVFVGAFSKKRRRANFIMPARKEGGESVSIFMSRKELRLFHSDACRTPHVGMAHIRGGNILRIQNSPPICNPESLQSWLPKLP